MSFPATVAALAALAMPALAPTVPDGFCADLERIVSAASEPVPFASLGAGPLRLGGGERCQAFTDHLNQTHVHCSMAWTISSTPLKTAPLANRARQCPGLDLRHIPPRAEGGAGERFAVAGSGGVEVAAITMGCQLCRGGERLLLVVDAPPPRR